MKHILSVPGMSCGHCKASIEGGVGGLAGVRQVQVDLEHKTVSVELESERPTLDEIAAAIESLGYDVPR